jgi:hypothetical protein
MSLVKSFFCKSIVVTGLSIKNMRLKNIQFCLTFLEAIFFQIDLHFPSHYTALLIGVGWVKESGDYKINHNKIMKL